MGWWDIIEDLAPAVISAGASAAQSRSAGRAADSQVVASQAGIAEQRRQFDLVMQMLQPQQQMGVNAMNTLSRLYGYAPSGATTGPSSAIGSTGIGVNGAGGIQQGVQGTSTRFPRDLNGAMAPAGIDERMAAALRSGGKLYNSTQHGMTPEDVKFINDYDAAYNRPSGISRIAGAGLDIAGALLPGFGALQAGVGLANNLLSSGPKQGPSASMQTATGNSFAPAQPTAQGPADMSVFTQSPDYQFRRDEGNRDINNSFAARGGALSGNALRGITDFNSNLASGEFNNFVQRQLQMAGLGGAATSQGVSAAQYAGGNVSNMLGQQGDARASGIVNQSNALTGGLNDLAGFFGDWSKRRSPAGSPGFGGGQYPWALSGGWNA